MLAALLLLLQRLCVCHFIRKLIQIIITTTTLILVAVLKCECGFYLFFAVRLRNSQWHRYIYVCGSRDGDTSVQITLLVLYFPQIEARVSRLLRAHSILTFCFSVLCESSSRRAGRSKNNRPPASCSLLCHQGGFQHCLSRCSSEYALKTHQYTIQTLSVPTPRFAVAANLSISSYLMLAYV